MKNGATAVPDDGRPIFSAKSICNYCCARSCGSRPPDRADVPRWRANRRAGSGLRSPVHVLPDLLDGSTLGGDPGATAPDNAIRLLLAAQLGAAHYNGGYAAALIPRKDGQAQGSKPR